MKALLLAMFLVTPALAASLEETALESIKKNETVPGTGIALMAFDKGALVLKKGFGLADRESNKPVTEKSLFAIGSTTKAFTALSLLMAEEEGLVDLSHPIREYIPDFSLSDADVLKEINTYDILSHHSGLPRHDLLPYVTYFSRPEVFYRMRFLDFNPKSEMGFRKGFQYNNLMYLTAGALLERVTGKSWENFVQEKILQRLGMQHTRASFSDSIRDENIATPYNETIRLTHKDITNMGPAGSIYSNLDDLELWVRFLLSGGTLSDGSRLVSQGQWAKLFSRQTKIDSPDDMYYGLGWLMIERKDQYIVYHNGNIDGFSTMILMLPKDGIAVVALVNQNGSKLGGNVANDIAKFLLSQHQSNDVIRSLRSLEKVAFRFDAQAHDKALEWKRAAAEILSETKSETPMMDWARLAGIYRNNAYGDFVVYFEAGVWRARYYSIGGPVKAEDDKTFSFPIQIQGEVFDFPAILDSSDGKTALLLPLEPAVAPIRFEKVQ